MQTYAPPIDEYDFLLRHVLDFESEMAELGVEADVDLATAILSEAGTFCAKRLHPLNRAGDEHGCRTVEGEVSTPPGFADAYRDIVAGGWPALAGDPAVGGQGLPFILQLWFDEMLAASNLSFGLFLGLTRGAAEAIREHASPELRALYLPNLISGRWTGAMALTEGGAGSDLSLLKAKATPNGDGTYALDGQKIFISSGDHDFGGNVIHLVLARLPDAPPGVKGISLFLAPKYIPDQDGTTGERNGMSVGALEAKMGIHGQPTCVMNYDGAKSWLVGKPNGGLAAMFTMMNAARIMVGIQGLGIAGAAYQQAAGYAKERLQGRSPDGLRGPVPIIEHADVRRMLLTVRAHAEPARALGGWVALQLDRGRLHPDISERTTASALVALLTPVIKAAFTDIGFESAVQAQQVFGGHGYIREWGMEQFVRDARITQIYEGTNGIQALDLVSRKIMMEGGAVVSGFLELIEAQLQERRSHDGAGFVASETLTALDRLRTATSMLQQAAPDARGAAATSYLRLFALVTLGWMWARISAATDRAPERLKPTLEIADFFARHILCHADGLARSISGGAEKIRLIANDDF